jgi:hypothetical protein
VNKTCKSTKLVDSQEVSFPAVKPYSAQLKMPFSYTLGNPHNTRNEWERSPPQGAKYYLHHCKVALQKTSSVSAIDQLNLVRQTFCSESGFAAKVPL